MKEFKELSKESYEKNEKKYIDFWEKIDILNKSIDKGKETWVFYDGPAFANPLPVKRYTKLISSNSLLNQGIIG